MTVDHLEGVQLGEDIDPIMSPELANAMGAMAMSEPEDDEGPVLISAPPDGTVTLPGGYLSSEGLIFTATVREMCGEDEEELSRPAVAKDFTRFLNTILLNCVEKIGDEGCTQEMLDDLLIGDREMLLQGIRIATYGNVMRLDIVCPSLTCKHEFKVDYDFNVDVPVQQLDGLEVKLTDGEHVIRLSNDRHTYLVPLRKGINAEVCLIDGGIQRSVYTPENAQRTSAEINTILLRKCVQTIDGDPVDAQTLRRMGSADRANILQFLQDSQPGPQWDEVKQVCPECDHEFPLVIDVGVMFRGF